MQDWGGPIGSSFAMRHPDLIKCLSYCNGNVPWVKDFGNRQVSPLPESIQMARLGEHRAIRADNIKPRRDRFIGHEKNRIRARSPC